MNYTVVSILDQVLERDDGAVRALHIYRLAPSDWLVSEVGRGNESRGPALADALAALAAGGVTLAWWRDVVTALDA